MSAKRKVVVVPLVVAVVLSLSAVSFYAAYWLWFRAPTVLRTNSPNNTHLVLLNGRSDRPWPFFDHSVRLTIYKSNEVVVSQRMLHYGDWLDPAYYVLYPQHAWVGENVLHLYNDFYFKNLLGGTVGTVVITNDSPLTLNYMLLKATDAHLILDLKPGNTVKLSIPPPRGDWEWLYAEWLVEGAAGIQTTSQTFRQNRQHPSRCLVTLRDSGVSIECPELQRYIGED